MAQSAPVRGPVREPELDDTAPEMAAARAAAEPDVLVRVVDPVACGEAAAGRADPVYGAG